MKKFFVILLVMFLVGAVQADMLSGVGFDGGFETATDDGYGSMVPTNTGLWASDWNSIDHEWIQIADGTANANAADGTTPHGGENMWMLAGGSASPCVGFFNEVSVTPGKFYTFGAWIKADSNNPPDHVEMGFDHVQDGGWQGNVVELITITNQWAYYEVTLDAWNNQIKPKIAPFGNTGASDGVLYTDGWKLIDPEFVGQATNPNPADGGLVPINLTKVSWTNPDPVNPADVISCTVYLEPNDLDPEFTSEPIATGVTTGEVDLILAGVQLQDEVLYNWRVDSVDPMTDPNGADTEPVVTQSVVWFFQVDDGPPAVDAGADEYVWLSKEDGDGDSGKATVTLVGTYTDEGKSAITNAGWIIEATEGGGDVVIESQTWSPGAGTSLSGTVEAVVSATSNGWLTLTLEMTDSSGTSSDTLNIGIYGTCKEAANEDPADSLTYDNAQTDLNGDCKVNLEDIAIIAVDWMQCLSEKAGC